MGRDAARRPRQLTLTIPSLPPGHVALLVGPDGPIGSAWTNAEAMAATVTEDYIRLHLRLRDDEPLPEPLWVQMLAVAGGPLFPESPNRPPSFGRVFDGAMVREQLPGRFPWTLTAHHRPYCVLGDQVVPGTPSAPIWAAEQLLRSYLADAPWRVGDTRTDLAAAFDGFAELADVLGGIIMHLVSEVMARLDDGTLVYDGLPDTVPDIEMLRAAHRKTAEEARARIEQHLVETDDALGGLKWDPLRVALQRMHADVLRSVRAALPLRPPDLPLDWDYAHQRLPGMTVVQLREQLGIAIWKWQTFSEETGRPTLARVAILARAVAWMHATGRDTSIGIYDPGRARPR